MTQEDEELRVQGCQAFSPLEHCTACLSTVLQLLCVADCRSFSNLLCTWSLMLTDLLSSVGMKVPLWTLQPQQFAAVFLP